MTRISAVSMLVVLFALVFSGVAAGAEGASSATASENTLGAQPTEVIIIGTTHQTHNTARSYSAAKVRQIVESLRPSAICVEMFEQDITPDGTIKPEVIKDAYSPEIAAVDDAARALGAPQVAFERQDRNAYWERIGYWNRQQRLNSRLNAWVEASQDPTGLDRKLMSLLGWAEQAQLSLAMYAPADVVNSDAYDAVVRIKHSIGDMLCARAVAASLYPEVAEDSRLLDEEWRERNRIMADNITRTAARYPGKRIVVTTGAEHRYMLRDALSGRPALLLKELWEVQPDSR